MLLGVIFSFFEQISSRISSIARCNECEYSDKLFNDYERMVNINIHLLQKLASLLHELISGTSITRLRPSNEEICIMLSVLNFPIPS